MIATLPAAMTANGNYSRFGHPSTQRLPETHSRVVSSPASLSGSDQKYMQRSAKPVLFGFHPTYLEGVSGVVALWGIGTISRNCFQQLRQRKSNDRAEYHALEQFTNKIVKLEKLEAKLDYLISVLKDQDILPRIRMLAAKYIADVNFKPKGEIVDILEGQTGDPEIGSYAEELIIWLTGQQT